MQFLQERRGLLFLQLLNLRKGQSRAFSDDLFVHAGSEKLFGDIKRLPPLSPYGRNGWPDNENPNRRKNKPQTDLRKNRNQFAVCKFPLLYKNFSIRNVLDASAQFARNNLIICQYPAPRSPYSLIRSNFACMLLTSSNQTSCLTPLFS